jgi:hypothetical protein
VIAEFLRDFRIHSGQRFQIEVGQLLAERVRRLLIRIYNDEAHSILHIRHIDGTRTLLRSIFNINFTLAARSPR